METDFYYINLTSKPVILERYDDEILREDLAYFKVKNPLELNDEDFKVFKGEEAAVDWIERFNTALKNLTAIKDSVSAVRERKAMLMKRIDLARIMMGEKLSTERDDNRMNFRKGDKIRFHDQKFNVPVEITRVVKLAEFYRFEFKLDNP